MTTSPDRGKPAIGKEGEALICLFDIKDDYYVPLGIYKCKRVYLHDETLGSLSNGLYKYTLTDIDTGKTIKIPSPYFLKYLKLPYFFWQEPCVWTSKKAKAKT